MTHRAETIMGAVLTKLTGLTTTGVNVARNKIFPWDDAVTDGLNIYMGKDSVKTDLLNINADWELEVEIELHTKNVNPETRINLIRSEVVVALMADRTQGLGYVIDTIESNWSKPEFSNEGERPVVVCIGIFLITYRRSINNPDA